MNQSIFSAFEALNYQRIPHQALLLNHAVLPKIFFYNLDVAFFTLIGYTIFT